MNQVPQHLHDHLVIRQKIWKRCRHKNQHFMGALVGREGTGKSWTAIRIAELADPDFGLDKILFKPDHLVERLEEREVSKGDVFVLDEAGVGVGNRTWYDPEQIHFNQILQLIRNENCAVLFTVPRGKEMDEQVRGRIIGYWETQEVNRDQEYVVTRYYNVDQDRRINSNNEQYEKYPRTIEDGIVHKVTRHKYYKATEELLERYEEKKTAFQREQYEKHTEDENSETQQRSAKEIAEEIKADGLDPYVAIHGGNKSRYIDHQLIEADYGLSQREAKKVKKLLDRDEDVTVSENEATDSNTAHTA